MQLDHVAVAARNLDEGRAWVEAALGVTLQPGGAHAHFGTHNLLLGLADGLYLEVIAVDPGAPPPGRARWFDLDRFTGPPRLGNWICRTQDLDGMVARFPGIGPAVPLARGDLRWRMAVPGDGILPFDNVFPAIMQWQGGTHPSERLAASGCSLRRLVVQHPDVPRLQAELEPVLEDARIDFCPGPAALRAEFETPAGPRVLG